jgi:hypothetical protein
MRKLVACTAICFCILVLAPALASSNGHGPDRLHRDQLEVGRALLEVQYANWPSVIPFYTEDIEYHDPIVDIYGIDMMAQFLERLLGSSPDLVTTIEDETLVDGVYSATWTMAGQFSGVPYSAKGISIMKFRPGSRQVYYQRDYYTEGDIMLNIPGLDEAITAFRTVYRCSVDPTFDCPLEIPANSDFPRLEPYDGSQEFEKRVDRNRPPIHRDQMEIGRALIELNAANWPAVIPYLAKKYEYHDPIVDIYGPDTMAEFLGRLFASSTDLITTVEDETLVRGVYMATWTMAGQFDGVPFSAPGMSIVKFRGGSRHVYYSRDYYTEGDIMINIPGLDEAVSGFRTFYRCAVDPTFECPLGPPEALISLENLEPGQDTSPPRATFELHQNVPNPFNPTTQISFSVPNGGANVSLRIYDSAGRLVRTLVNGYEPPGTRTVSWLGENDQGQPVASGIYFYKLSTPSFSKTKKMILLD